MPRHKGATNGPPHVRFWRYVQKTDGCWLWIGGKTGGGYGSLGARVNGKQAHLRAHILSWEIHNGPVPDGQWVLHKCDTPACVNPAHLFLGTRSDNMRDAYEKGRSNLIQHPEIVPKGEAHHKAKLNWERVRTIRSRHAAGETQKGLASEYGVSQATIAGVVHNWYWKE